jgi:L-amino acid N-acyltransferase YncA
MIVIRPFNQTDYPSVKIIYQQGIDTGNATFQLQAKEWPQWNASMLACCRLVAVENKTILGWAALSAISNREVYAGVAEVSVYVAFAAQGKGVGQQLLDNLIVASEKNNIWTLQASIFPENQASINLHENNRFRIVGVREKLGQINGLWRDVTLMERRSKIIGVVAY